MKNVSGILAITFLLIAPQFAYAFDFDKAIAKQEKIAKTLKVNFSDKDGVQNNSDKRVDRKVAGYHVKLIRKK